MTYTDASKHRNVLLHMIFHRYIVTTALYELGLRGNHTFQSFVSRPWVCGLQTLRMQPKLSGLLHKEMQEVATDLCPKASRASGVAPGS